MGLLKLVIAAIVIICIIVLVREFLKYRRKEKMVENLTDELDTVNDGFTQTDLEIDIVDAKTELKAKRATLAEKTVDLNTTGSATKEAPSADPLKAVPPKKKVAKKKAAPKKKAVKKKVAKKKAAPKKKVSPKTGNK